MGEVFKWFFPQLVKQYGVNKDILPPKKLSGNLSKHLIDNRRILLEQYLQKIIHSEPLISRSPELQVFLDVPTHVSTPHIRYVGIVQTTMSWCAVIEE